MKLQPLYKITYMFLIVELLTLHVLSTNISARETFLTKFLTSKHLTLCLNECLLRRCFWKYMLHCIVPSCSGGLPLSCLICSYGSSNICSGHWTASHNRSVWGRIAHYSCNPHADRRSSYVPHLQGINQRVCRLIRGAQGNPEVTLRTQLPCLHSDTQCEKLKNKSWLE